MKIKDLRQVVMHQELYNTCIRKTKEILFEGTFDKLPETFDSIEVTPHIRQQEYAIELAVN